MTLTNTPNPNITRRDFTRAGIAAGAAGIAAPSVLGVSLKKKQEDTINVGLIGSGGRGTGAAINAMDASTDCRIVAIADAFENRVNSSRGHLAEHDRAQVAENRCYVGFDAYKQLIDEADCDTVILATPPHFRPMHLEYAISKGKSVFMEKPVAVDPVGIRKVIAAGEEADRKGLSIVAGTQRRHERCYLEMFDRIGRGDIGDVVAARCWWNGGSLWHGRAEQHWAEFQRGELTPMEYQMRNWYFFTWICGDHIVEQHIHNLDVVNWAMGGPPVKCTGMGGRQVRTAPQYGHIFDHFAVDYEYSGGRICNSQCRQTDGTDSRVAEAIRGTDGYTWSHSGGAQIFGDNAWKFEDSNPNPYVEEHRDLHASIRGQGDRLNEARRVAESTLTAIMGRMSAYTGKEVTWDFAMNQSTLDLSPESYDWGDIEMPTVAVPGRTPLI